MSGPTAQVKKRLPLIKTVHGLKYFTGAHPDMKNLLKKNNRPTEFGNKVWPTSLILVDYLETQPFPLNGLRVLEIGCGWGLLGLYLAKKHDCQVTLTDIDKKVLPIVQRLADLNNINVTTKCLGFTDISEEFLKDFDLIIGAEVCYSDSIAVDICRLIERAFSAGVSNVVIGDPGRPGFDECITLCTDNFIVNLTQGAGTPNGKVTNILNVTKN